MKKYLKSLADTLIITHKIYLAVTPIFAWLLILFIFSTVDGLLYSVVIAESFRNILDSASSGFTQTFFYDVAFFVGLVLAVALIWGLGINYLRARIKSKSAIIFREKILNTVLNTDKSKMILLDIGVIEKIYTQDVKQTIDFLIHGVFARVFSPIVEGIGCIMILWTISPLLSSISITMGIAVFLIQSQSVFSNRSYADEISKKKESLSSHVNSIIFDFPIIRIFNAAQAFKEKAEKINHSIYALRTKMLYIEVKQSTVELFLMTIQDMSLLILGGILLRNNQISMGALLAAMKYGVSVMGIFSAITSGITGVQNNRAAAKMVLNAIETNDLPQKKLSVKKLKADDNNHAVEINNLSLTIDNKRIISDISLSLNYGEKIAITGKSGSGKTTFVQTLLGLYKNFDGEIKLFQKTDSDRELFSNICYIPSKSYLFRDTIYNNITLFSKDAAEEEVEHAIKLVGMMEWYSKQKFGIHTVLDNNVTLSGGEAQRLAIARSFISKYDVYIWDEPTAALDGASKEIIMNAFQKLPNEALKIIITHDSTLLRLTDRVIVFENGKIV